MKTENEIVYRSAALDDLDELVRLELEVWGPGMGACREKWIYRIGIFRAGTCVAIRDGRIVGSAVAHIIDWKYPPEYYPSWAEAAADGYITNHDSEGNVLFAVNLTVLPKMPAVADGLLERFKVLMRQCEIPRGYVGCRIPFLREYMRKKNLAVSGLTEDLIRSLARRDPTVRFFMRKGFEIVSVRRDYFPEDTESLGWGVILKIEKK